jgi:hypothetical protein
MPWMKIPKSREKNNLQGPPGTPEDRQMKPCTTRPPIGFPAQQRGTITCRGHTRNQQPLYQETHDLQRHPKSRSYQDPHR